MAAKDKLNEGDRVRFLRTHDKAVQLTGRIAGIPAGPEDVVEIELEKDGKLVEVEGVVEVAHAADVEVLEPAKKGKAKAKD